MILPGISMWWRREVEELPRDMPGKSRGGVIRDLAVLIREVALFHSSAIPTLNS
jgi:hypothetical protein